MIDLLFTLLNFGIVVFLLGYLFKRSVPAIKAAVEAEIDREKDLHAEHHQLLAMQHHLDESTVRQEDECARLSTKINEWKAAMETAKREREAELVFHKKELEKRVAAQSGHYRLHTLYNTVSPLVVAELERTLTSYYQDEKRAHAYIERCMGELKK